MPRVPLWYRNFNRFPFRHGRLRHALGPTYPRLTTHCRGTLALSAEGILTPLCCYYHRDFQSRTGPPDLTARLLPSRDALLPDHNLSVVPWGFGGWLSPVHFQGRQPRRVSCYAFFKGWLLLSLPSRCLGLTTPFRLTFSQHLGALTSVWVVPLSA